MRSIRMPVTVVLAVVGVSCGVNPGRLGRVGAALPAATVERTPAIEPSGETNVLWAPRDSMLGCVTPAPRRASAARARPTRPELPAHDGWVDGRVSPL